jgi:hypothetical protein
MGINTSRVPGINQFRNALLFGRQKASASAVVADTTEDAPFELVEFWGRWDPTVINTQVILISDDQVGPNRRVRQIISAHVAVSGTAITRANASYRVAIGDTVGLTSANQYLTVAVAALTVGPTMNPVNMLAFGSNVSCQRLFRESTVGATQGNFIMGPTGKGLRAYGGDNTVPNQEAADGGSVLEIRGLALLGP